VAWLGVDVPEVVALRERLLPSSPRARSIAGSALDEAWLDEVDPSRPVLVTAQGLLMYLPRADVHRLVGACGRRLPGGVLLFDAVPAWLAARTREEAVETPGGYRPPPWLWAVDAEEERALASIPGVASLRSLTLPRGRGLVHGRALPLLTRIPALRRLTLSVYVARLAG
jgi:O-methyltransferase involved in polyketide biosynthesis